VSERVLRPTRRRNVRRALYGVLLSAAGIAMLVTGYWFGAGVLLIGLWPLSMSALVAFWPRAYELHLLDDRFQVFDLFGRLTHDVPWRDVVAMQFVGVNAWSDVVVAWVCSPRHPKRGRWRWKRGTEEDDGCLPDTYAMAGDDLMNLMWSYWGAAQKAAPPVSPTLEPF
jgi:hypothetical protein